MNENGKTNAFPFTEYPNSSELGLSKREYFAAMAMQGLISSSSQSDDSRNKYTVNDGWVHPETIVKCSIEIADELLNQLES